MCCLDSLSKDEYEITFQIPGIYVYIKHRLTNINTPFWE